MHDCPTCGQQTPDGHFCVRCGAPLDRELAASRHRSQFAAAPGEQRYAPWLVSTLFPHLPRHSERHFHIALGGGTALVIVLGALRLFGVALISAALLLPLLTVLYFYDVDIYEGEPAWAATWTLVWGALTGVGVGLLAKAVSPTGPALIDRGSGAHVVTGGVLLPALGVVAMLAGPMVLLRYRRFNEALDGATFGAATAAVFAAAQAVVVGVDVLSGGLRQAGAAAPWVARLAAIAIATPVLSMSAIGAASAAVWLRYRAPVSDRGALGPLGLPPVAVVIAALLVIAGAIGETFMTAGAWLAWLGALDLVALVLLRRALHVGLLEEASEIEIGPEIRCANCQAITASHTFCADCGIALKALPKVRDAQAADADTAGTAARARRGTFAGRLSAEHQGRRSGRRRLVAFAISLAAVVGIALLVGALAAPGPRKPRCGLHTECGSPPIVRHVVFAFPGYTAWHSSGLGYALRFNSSDWQIATQGADDVQLRSDHGVSAVLVTAVPASAATPTGLMKRRLSSLQGQLLGLSTDPDRDNQLLGSGVGLITGPGGVYTATIASPQGPQTPVSIAIMAATDGHLSIAVTVIAPSNNVDQRSAIYQQADDIINSIQFST